MPSEHADPAITVRPPIEVQQAAKAILRDHNREIRAFVVACLTTLTKEPEKMLDTIAQNWPPPARRGRPVGPKNVIYAFRRAGDPNAPWFGDPDALPSGEYETSEMDFQPALPNRFRGKLEIRYGPLIADEDTPPSTFVYTTVDEKRMRPTVAVHELLFGAGTK